MVGEIKVNVPEGLPLNDLRKKILDKYYGSVKLDRTVSIEEILDPMVATDLSWEIN